MPNDLAFDSDTLLRLLKSDFPDMDWVERIHFAGLIDVPDEKGETRAQGTSLDLGLICCQGTMLKLTE